MPEDTTQAAEVTAQATESGTGTPTPSLDTAVAAKVADTKAEANKPDTSKTDANGLPTDPAELQKMIVQLRKENGSARVEAKTKAADEARQALVQELGKALGLVKDEAEKVTPEQLQQQLSGALDGQKEAAVQLAVYKAAGAQGANPDALLDSNKFLSSIKTLAVDAEDFADKIGEHIKAAVAANPSLRAQVAGKSGTEMSGGSGEGAKKPANLQDAVNRRYGA